MAMFSDQVVWITGAGSGLGRAMAEVFALEGADVALSGRKPERLEKVADIVRGLGRNALVVPCDVTDEAQVEAAVKRVVGEMGKLDVAVANAGMSVSGRIAKLSADEWRRQLDVNVVGAAMTAKFAIPELTRTKGRLALVGSVSGTIAWAGAGAYTASKYAVRAMGQTLSMELLGTGVSCTTLQPGFVESEIALVDNSGTLDLSRTDKRPKRFMWASDRAARVMVKAIHRRKRECTFTGHGRIAATLGQHAPGFVYLAAKLAGPKRRRSPSE